VTLINAVSKYRIGSNSFSTYAYNAIKNQLRYTARGNLKHASVASLNAVPQIGDESGSEIIDFIPAQEDVEEDLIKAEEIRSLKKAVAKLPADELEFVIMVYYSGISIKAYAEKKGLSYNQAMRKKVRILRKLRVDINIE
jgi:RNA polymerase sporulation-specific sigma factor